MQRTRSLNRRLFVLIASCVYVTTMCFAGTNGILEGTIKDKKNGEPLPGVNVVLVDLQRGVVTDSKGYYQLQNVRAGLYQVRFSLIGFTSKIIKNIIVNPDLRTRLNIDLEQSDINLEEVVVVQDKPLIQKDVTGTTFITTGKEIEALPIDAVTDVITLKPGVTLEGNVRGGKTTEVVYLVDGLPIQDVLVGGVSSSLPNSSIASASIYTGGFEPEYGNALSGVVNIVTRTGTSNHKLLVRADKDNLFGGTQVSKTNEVEVSASGPIIDNELYYVGALNGLLTDTRWWQDFRYFFDKTIDKTFSGFGKVDYLFTPTLRLGGQVLFSNHEWHDYEFNWRFNLAGLPPQKRNSYRLAAILSHSVSDDFFYTASLSRFFVDSRISDGTKESIPVNDPYQYDFFLRYIVDGQRAWWNRNTQESYNAKFDGTWKAGQEHLLKFGGEFTYFNLTSDLVKYEPRKTYFGKPLVNEPQLNYTSAYAYFPKSGAVYIQDKIDLSAEGILLNAGLRYDFLDPTATRPAIEAIPVSDTAYTFNYKGSVKASWKHQLSPRFGVAMQVAENGYLFVNLGWYVQYPLFDYMYTGLDRVAVAKGISALTGNPDLEPERTKSYEISLKYAFPQDIVGSITYFRKETTNQIDTKTFIPGDSKLAGSFGFAEYVNNPYGEARGLEFIVSRERGEWIRGDLSYTIMEAKGTSGSAQDGYYIAQYGLPPATRIYPLSWDQRHAVKATTTFLLPWDMSLNVVAEYHSGRPYTRYPTATGFEPVKGEEFQQNNERMPRYFNLNMKAAQSFRFDWWPNTKVTVYGDIRNLTNEKNVKWVDSNGRIGGELSDPAGYYIGRRSSVGLQVEF